MHRPEFRPGGAIQLYCDFVLIKRAKHAEIQFLTDESALDVPGKNHRQGATASARLYSLIETAKANELKIYDYLVWMFENIHVLSADELLPWNEKFPKIIRKS